MDTKIHLDQMLTPEQAAEWLQIPRGELMKKHRAGIIPGFKVGRQTIRFHPRTVIAKLARNASMSSEAIAAMLNMNPAKG